MKKLIFLISAFIILSASGLSAQQTLRFGNVSLKDTTSGSIKHKSGGIYTDFVNSSTILIPGDAGFDFLISGQSNGILMALNGEISEFSPNGIKLYVPFYLNQYTSTQIGGLSVDNGAMVIDSDTGELLIFLNDTWNSVNINPK